jgi:hypothetical protein
VISDHEVRHPSELLREIRKSIFPPLNIRPPIPPDIDLSFVSLPTCAADFRRLVTTVDEDEAENRCGDEEAKSRRD